MNIQTFDPEQISISNRAKNHVHKQLADADANGLLLCVSESGCNGYMFELSFVNSAPADSREFDYGDGVRVFVENRNWELVRGTHIDYITEGLNSSLKFDNPNAESLCGCGESFSIRGT